MEDQENLLFRTNKFSGGRWAETELKIQHKFDVILLLYKILAILSPLFNDDIEKTEH